MEIITVLAILAVVICLLVTEWVALEVLALLVLGVLAVTGIVSPTEALAGFSNPAVVTIWAVFILSGGLTRTGIADILGRQLLKIGGGQTWQLVSVIMVIAGALSAFMNNVAIAALMLPVVMDIARKTDHSPSILLLPLAYGSLLGGLTTMIGTPPNILVSEALRENGMVPFAMFDFTPVGIIVMAVGIVFVTVFAIRFLPKKGPGKGKSTLRRDFLAQYELEKRLFQISVPSTSTLVGKTLADSRLGAGLGLNVVGLTRGRRTLLAPTEHQVIEANDTLIVEGRLDRIQEMNHWGQLLTETDTIDGDALYRHGMQVASVAIASPSAHENSTLSEMDFRNRYGLNVLAVRRDGRLLESDLKDERLQAGDELMVHGPDDRLDDFSRETGFTAFQHIDPQQLKSVFRLGKRLHELRVPDGSRLIGLTLNKSRLGDAVDVHILSMVRQNGQALVPMSQDQLAAGDRLVVSGADDMIAVLLMQGLEGVFVETNTAAMHPMILENDQVGLMEVTLSPHSQLSGQSLSQLNFRKKYGLSVMAIWRKGRAYRSDLRDMALSFGDALLLYGPWKNLDVLGREPDFLVLTGSAQQPPRKDKALLAIAIMAAVIAPVILGWTPIYIAVVIGAACMVLTKCLTMDEAYRFIEWKAVFLIAGMLPLGTALDQTGAARLLALGVVDTLGPHGPHAVLFGLMAITFVATSIIPTAALVVLMVPIALETATGLSISPHALLMGIAMAASSSFTSPISHPANVLVMGPGGYRFVDFVKAGVPLTLIIMIVLMVVIPIFWPLTP